MLIQQLWKTEDFCLRKYLYYAKYWRKLQISSNCSVLSTATITASREWILCPLLAGTWRTLPQLPLRQNKATWSKSNLRGGKAPRRRPIKLPDGTQDDSTSQEAVFMQRWRANAFADYVQISRRIIKLYTLAKPFITARKANIFVVKSSFAWESWCGGRTSLYARLTL